MSGRRGRTGMPRFTLRQVRLLPVLVVTATLVLTTKLVNVADGVDRVLAPGLAVGTAHAKPAKPEPPTPATPAEEAGNGEEQKRAEGQPDAPKPADAGKQARDKAAEADAPAVPSPQEMQVLQALAQRREVLDVRAQELDRRADLLQAAEATLDRKLAEMKELEATLVGLIRTHEEQQDAKLRSLVKIYENMKPKDASRIFEELEMDTLLPVVERMGERKLAPIMADMNPIKAKAITEELARLRQMTSKNRPTNPG
jgi:flagellar motility protein MotE (MotC chaperone)